MTDWHFPEFELRLFLSGFPMDGRRLPPLTPSSRDAILAALSFSLGGKKLGDRARDRLFKRIDYARITCDQLEKRGSRTIPLYWMAKNDAELKDIRDVAEKLASMVETSDSTTLVQFSHYDEGKLDTRDLRRITKNLAKIASDVYTRRPPKAPPQIGDLPLNALVALLVLAWEQATGLSLSRSTNRTKSPIQFIDVVLCEIGRRQNQSRIDSALQWLLRYRRQRARGHPPGF